MAQFVPLTRHEMAKPFPNMDRKNIEVTFPGEVSIWEIVTAESPDNKTFGMRIEQLLGWEQTGPMVRLIRHKSQDLTKEQIQRIKETGIENIPFSLDLR